MLHFLYRKPLLQDLLFLVPLAVFSFLFQLGGGSLASWDEAIYATVSREILHSGNWVHLTLGGSPWFEKPPLCLWVTAFFYKILGVQEFSARLFSALCGIGCVITTYFLGRDLFDRWIGFLSAAVLLTSSHFIHVARFGVMDSPVTLFLTLHLYFFWLGQRRNRYLIFSGIALGLAIMTKGFAAFLVLPVVWLYCLLSGEVRVLGRSSYWIGLMIAAGIALPWHLYQGLTERGTFMKDVVGHYFFDRVSTVLDGHKGNAFFYIRVLVNKYHPWVIVGIVSAPFFLFKSIKDRFGPVLFVTVWMFLILLVITLMQTKLDWYILPVYPALSVSIGWLLAKLFRENRKIYVQILFFVVMILHASYSHILNNDYSRGIKAAAPTMNLLMPPGSPVHLYNYHESPAIFFYTGRPSRYVDDAQALVSEARSQKSFFCLIRTTDLKAVESGLRAFGVSVQGQFADLSFLVKAAR